MTDDELADLDAAKWRDRIASGRAEEREECAKVADALGGCAYDTHDIGPSIAAAIRARNATQADGYTIDVQVGSMPPVAYRAADQADEDDVTPEAIAQLRSEAEPILAVKTWTNAATRAEGN